MVLHSGSVEIKDSIKAELINSEQFQLSFSRPAALLDDDDIMKAMLSIFYDLNDGQGPLMAQGLRDYTDPIHSEAGQDVVSTSIIPLPFLVKPDSDEASSNLMALILQHLSNAISGLRTALCYTQ